tara:strand:+ start:815 stop:1300 length:486 start_codon:yes stop_codon:yes gene_type:complete
MILVDYIFIAITIFYSLIGLIRGFSAQLISIIMWIIFLFFILNHLEYFIDHTSNYIFLEENYIRVFTVLLLTIITLVSIFLLNLTLAKVIASTIFANSNRILGLLISVVKAQIYIFIFILVILDTSFRDEVLKGSYFLPYYLYLVDYISIYDDSLFNSFKI